MILVSTSQTKNNDPRVTTSSYRVTQSNQKATTTHTNDPCVHFTNEWSSCNHFFLQLLKAIKTLLRRILISKITTTMDLDITTTLRLRPVIWSRYNCYDAFWSRCIYFDGSTLRLRPVIWSRYNCYDTFWSRYNYFDGSRYNYDSTTQA
jgi:hypothetical protein